MTNFPKPLSHGAITEVTPGVYCIRGAFRMGPGILIGRTMTVVDGDEGLAVFNAVRLDEASQAKLDELGEVKHLVKLSDSHGIDEPFYADRYKPTLWSLPGAKLEELTPGESLTGEGPVKGGVVVDYGQTAGWREAAYWVPAGGGTLVTCDAVQNHVDTEFASFGGKMMASVMGFKGGVLVPPMWRRFHKLSGPAVSDTLSRLTELSFENLVTGHGPPVIGGADARLRNAIQSASA
jgi:hypothetical protein